jgi:hypothetical protein
MKKSKNASAAELKAIPDAAEKEMRQAGRVQLMASCVLCLELEVVLVLNI